MKYPCPACGFEVHDEPAGSFDICPICGWEDDPAQLRFPHLPAGGNEGSLWQWQQQVLKRWPLEIKQIETFARNDWRPLTAAEAEVSDPPQSGGEYLDVVAQAAPEYYWRR